ncbi:MAG: hypothetical protein WBA67_01025 [Jannaschia sp.]
MSRQTWMDRTIEAARTEDYKMPWQRSAKPAPQPAPVQIKAQA